MSRSVLSPLRRAARWCVAATVGAALAAGGAWSCSASTDPAGAPVAEIALSDTAVVLRLGDEAALVASPRQSGGASLVGRRVFWSSRDPGVVEVSQAGVIRAVAVGTTQVAASLEGRGASATVTVLPRAIATVQIEPATIQLAVSARRQLVARTLDDAGAPATATVTWTSLSPEVLSVGPTGEVTALSAGVGAVRADAEGASGTAAVVVTPVPVASVVVAPQAATVVAGASTQLAATARDAAGAALAGRVVSWSSRNAGVAVVSSTGLVTGIAPGTAEVVAAVDGQSAVATVTVQAVPVADVVVTPDNSTIGVGGTVRLGALVADAAGNALAGRAVAFTSSAPGVAGVEADGVVTGLSAGVATITATSEGVSGAATVRVVASTAVASVSVTPPTATLLVGATRQLAATPRAADGSPVGGRPVTWSSATPGVATVSAAGVVTAVAPGTAQVLAQVDGITGSATVTVQRVPVAAVQVTPGTASLPVGANVALAATPRDAGGNALAGRTVLWTSDNAAVAVVTSEGRVVGVTPGTTTVRATSEGVTGTAAITVVVSVRISPQTASVRDRGNSRTAQLVAVDAAGDILPAGQVTWQSADPAIATVSNTGLVRGISSGPNGTTTTTITATYQGVSATATVTVTRN